MRSAKTVSILLVFSIIVLTMTACGGKDGKGAESSAPVSSQSAVSSQPESSSDAPSEVSSAVSSTAVAIHPNEPTESQNGPVITVKTDDKEFNKKFADNPIDKAYIKEAANAVSNVDMVNVSDKYSVLWQKEISHAYAELTKYMKTDSSTKPQQLKAEQEKWESGVAAELKKIGEDAQAAGGSMAQVNEASQVMDFYRARAAQIYHELYAYDKDYSYAFQSAK